MQLIDPDSGRVLVEATEARGIVARMRGLLGRTSLPSGHGLILKGKQVHTKGMKFAIDAVYLSQDGSILQVARLDPGRVGPRDRRAKWVLEIAADDAARLGIRKGGVLEMRP